MDKPDKLYKYCDQGGLNILKTNEIKVSQFFDFNDPFEMNPVFLKEELRKYPDKQIKKRLRILKKMKLPKKIRRNYTHSNVLKTKKAVIEFLKTSFRRTFNNMLRVLCLSLEPDNILMWSHYAAQYSGIVIEFEKNHDFFREYIKQDGKIVRYSHLVSYEERRPISEKAVKDKNSVHFKNTIQNIFYTKSPNWSYEKEWRMIFPSTDKNIREEIIDKKKCSFFKLPPDCISGVILSYKAWESINGQESMAKKVIRTIRERQKNHLFPPIEIKKAVLDESEFKLNIVDVLKIS